MLCTYASGKMTAQSHPKMRHPIGTADVVRMITTKNIMKDNKRDIQKRFKILGTSCQKLERSTSFFVAPQVMLYENRWARSAWDK